MTDRQLDLFAEPVNTEVENWRAVPAYKGLYEVSDLGRVRSLPRTTVQPNGGVFVRAMRILQPGRWQSGHLFVILSKEGKRERFGVHRLVLLAFVGPCPPGQEGLHGPDHNPANNRLANLRWGTRRENWQDAVDIGSRVGGQVGLLNVNAKLTAEQVREIRAATHLTQCQLAAMYSVGASTIWYVRNGHRYGDVT
jgi:hypothetical protein